LYIQLNISNSTVIVTDMKKNLMIVIETQFSRINHLLCIWHINKNVVTNCKRSFNKKEWDVFFTEWNTIVYALLKQLLWELWDRFSVKYSDHDNDHVVKYLIIIYITHVQRFAKCFSNRILHFNTTITSRDERRHAVMKRQLRTLTDDLKIVINEISLILINEYHDFQIRLNENRARFSMKLRKLIFQQIFFYIITLVIRRIFSQYQLLTERSTTLSACTSIFITSTDLFCSHKIQKRLYDVEKFLLIEDVHSHWRFERNSFLRTINLLMKESDIVRSRDWSWEAENKRTQIFDISINRQSSQFERVIMKIDEMISTKMKRVIRRAESTTAASVRERSQKQRREARTERIRRTETRSKTRSTTTRSDDEW
jgi:hypothetical protein